MRTLSTDMSHVDASNRCCKMLWLSVCRKLMFVESVLLTAGSWILRTPRTPCTAHSARAQPTITLVRRSQLAVALHAPICSSTNLLFCCSLLLSSFVRRDGSIVMP